MNTLQSIPYKEFVDEVLAVSQPPFKAENTHIKMRSTLQFYSEIARPKSTADFTFPSVVQFVKGRREKGACVNTVRGDLSYLSSAFSYGCERRWLEINPCLSKRLRLSAEPRITFVPHSLQEIGRVLDHLEQLKPISWKNHRLFAFASLVAYTGLRRNEALYLKCEDIDLKNGFLGVSPRNRLKTKASAAPVPLPPPLIPILTEWIPVAGSEWLFSGNAQTTPWISGALRDKAIDQLKAAGEAVGVKGLTIRSLRHDYATHSESAWGLSELTLQRVLRHTTPLTQRNYRHPEMRNLVQAVSGVSYASRSVPA